MALINGINSDFKPNPLDLVVKIKPFLMTKNPSSFSDSSFRISHMDFLKMSPKSFLIKRYPLSMTSCTDLSNVPPPINFL